MKVYHKNQMIADQVFVADNFMKRLVGLMGREQLKPNEGLLLKKCPSIHCLFMKFPIDAVYLTEDMKVLWAETVRPWKLGSMIKGTRNILELTEGTAKYLNYGDCLIFLESENQMGG